MKSRQKKLELLRLLSTATSYKPTLQPSPLLSFANSPTALPPSPTNSPSTAPHPSAQPLQPFRPPPPYYPDLFLTLLPRLVTTDVFERADEVLPRDVAVELFEPVREVLPPEVPDELFEPVAVLCFDADFLLASVLSGKGPSGKGPSGKGASGGPSGRAPSGRACLRGPRPAAPVLFFPVCTLVTLLTLAVMVLVEGLVGFLPLCVLPLTVFAGTGSRGTAGVR